MREVRQGCEHCRVFGLRVFGSFAKGWATHASVEDSRSIVEGSLDGRDKAAGDRESIVITRSSS